MAKKNKNTRNKNRQYHFNYKVIQQKILPRQELLKFVFRSKRKLFRKISKQNSQMIILKIFMSLIKIFQSVKNNIKYIMFQAYFLCFYIFNTIFSKFVNSKKYVEKTHKDSTDKKYEPNDEEKEIKTEPKTENSENKDKSVLSHNKNHKGKENNDDSDKIITIEENFDSSTELWNIANDIIIMNMKTENEDINRSIESCNVDDPIEISIINNINSEIITSQENELSENELSSITNDFQTTQFSKSFIDEQDSISSVDEEEDGQIFQKQYNSSEDEFKSSLFHTCCASCKCEKSKQNNFYCRKVINNYSHNSPFIPESKNKERMKKTNEYANDKRKKVISHENEKYTKYKNDKNTKKEKKENSRKNVSPKDKSCFSRMPIKFNKRKYKNIKYKEVAIQTDNSLLEIDDNVEIISTDANRFSEQQFYCKSQFNHFQGRVIVQELNTFNYIADNEESSIGFLRIAHKQITSCSTSSSSTDLGFDEDTSIIPDMNDVIRHLNISNDANTSPRCTRPPPGFPEIPQNRPLMSQIYDPINFILASSTYENSINTYNSRINTITIVPPMPHLYYDYPEFMDFPTYNNFSGTF